jgi:hypothetical protein
MSQKRPQEAYWWYFPIYNLRNPSNNVKLGYAKILRFENLPRQVRKEFLYDWENQYTINSEYERSKKDYISKKRNCAVLHLVVEAPSWTEAIDESFKLATIFVSILSFLYRTHFPVEEGRFISGEITTGGRRVSSGTSGEYYHRRSLDICEYKLEFEKEISKLTEILTQPKSEIDRRIGHALVIFGIQTSVSDENVKFVLLATCLESLLIGKSDRDYLGLRLAEKSAFLFARDREIMYERIKKAYDKRSGFIHGSGETITQSDVFTMQLTVVSILRRLLELREKGYDRIEKIDTYIYKLKFKDSDQ